MAGEFDARFQAFQSLPREQKAAKIQMLSDDQKQAFVKSYNDWKASSPGTQSSPKTLGPEYSPQKLAQSTVAPQGQSVMSGGLPDGAFSKPNKQQQPVNDYQDYARAFVGGVSPAFGMAIDGANYLKNEMTGQGNDHAWQSYSLPQKVPGSAQDAIHQSMERHPITSIAGMVAGPKSNPLSGAGTALKIAGGAGQGYIQGKTFQHQNQVEDGSAGALGAAIGGAIPAGGSVLDWAAGKIAPKALQMMRQMANQILQSKASMNPAKAVQLENAASQMGFSNKFDDVLYTVIKYLSPQTIESGLSRQGRMGQVVRESGQDVGKNLQKMKGTNVPSGQLLHDLGGVRNELATRADAQSNFGPQASRIVEKQFMQTPQNIVNSGQSKDISLESIYKKSKAIKDGNFNPAYQVSNPKESPLLASQEVTNYALKKANYSPDQVAALQSANKDYSLKAQTQELLANNNASTGGGVFNQNTPVGQVRGVAGRVVRQAGAPVVYKGSKFLADRALSRLQRRYGVVGSVTDRSPFQVQMLRNKLQKISQMQPRQAATYAFAQSMVNPMFRQIWTDVEDK